MSPCEAKELPSKLDLGLCADLASAAGLPELWIPSQETDSTEHHAVLSSNNDELTEPVDIPSVLHQRERRDSVGVSSGFAGADKSHHLLIAYFVGDRCGVIGERQAQDESLSVDHGTIFGTSI
jgi:hypothetical protein